MIAVSRTYRLRPSNDSECWCLPYPGVSICFQIEWGLKLVWTLRGGCCFYVSTRYAKQFGRQVPMVWFLGTSAAFQAMHHGNSHFDSIQNKSHLVLKFETAAVNLLSVRLLHRCMINREELCFKHVFLYWVLCRMRRFLRLVTTKPYKILPQK